MKKEACFAVVLAAFSLSISAAAEDAGEKKTLSYGVGLRVSPGYVAAGSGGNDSIGIQQLDVRPYISGQVHPMIKFAGNLDLNNSDMGRIHVLDAVGKVEPDELFNVWFGRFLPPSDRANLSGPYFQNAWNFPSVNGYPAVYAGRADGVAVWGQVAQGRFKYQGGVFTTNPATKVEEGIYAGRLVFNFLDPEPGYFNSSTYYGTKDILALGGAIQYQKLGSVFPTGTTTAPNRKDLVGFNIDLLFEKRLPTGNGDTVTVEGAYYNFNKGSQGWSFFGLVSYLFGPKIGIGQLQPMARYAQQTPTDGGSSTKIIDGGVNYIVDGHNTRFALVVQNVNPPVGSSSTSVQVGLQIQE